MLHYQVKDYFKSTSNYIHIYSKKVIGQLKGYKIITLRERVNENKQLMKQKRLE